MLIWPFLVLVWRFDAMLQVSGHAAATFAVRPDGHGAEMGGGPAAGDVSDLFRAGGAAMPAVSGLFSSADMASGPSGQDDWERGAGSAASASVYQLQKDV